MNIIARKHQSLLDKAGEEFCFVLRVFYYTFSVYYGFYALFGPITEYCYIGKWKLYKLWQKLCFSVLAASLSFGFFKLARTAHTSKVKAYL